MTPRAPRRRPWLLALLLLVGVGFLLRRGGDAGSVEDVAAASASRGPHPSTAARAPLPTRTGDPAATEGPPGFDPMWVATRGRALVSGRDARACPVPFERPGVRGFRVEVGGGVDASQLPFVSSGFVMVTLPEGVSEARLRAPEIGVWRLAFDPDGRCSLVERVAAPVPLVASLGEGVVRAEAVAEGPLAVEDGVVTGVVSALPALVRVRYDDGTDARFLVDADGARLATADELAEIARPYLEGGVEAGVVADTVRDAALAEGALSEEEAAAIDALRAPARAFHERQAATGE